MKCMTLTLETALSLISPFHEFLNVSIWTVITRTWCWHFPKKWPIPTIAQKCRFWQVGLNNLHILWNCWNFQVKRYNQEVPVFWIYLKLIWPRWLTDSKGTQHSHRLLSSQHLSINLSLSELWNPGTPVRFTVICNLGLITILVLYSVQGKSVGSCSSKAIYFGISLKHLCILWP